MTADVDFAWIDDPSGLEGLLAALERVERFALDTEFHRERTFFPRLALIQVAWEGEIALIDPLAVDVTQLARVFQSETVVVVHAGQQDLDVLRHAVGAVPRRLYDTQLGGGFLGYGTPSLGALVSAEIGITPAKGDRLTDWLRRPLSSAQLNYAAADVAYLLEIQDRQLDELARLGRLGWVEGACAELLERGGGPSDPERAWLKLKDARSLKPSGRAVAQAVAAWRERRAMASDVPVRHVLADLAILGIAQRQPTSAEELSQCRGVESRSIKGAMTDEILEAVRVGRQAPPPESPPSSDDLDRDLRPAVALLAAWITQLAKDERIDASLLATRADLVAQLRGDAGARLGSGWRAEVLGDGLRRLLDGSAGLGFSPGQGLRLVPLASGD